MGGFRWVFRSLNLAATLLLLGVLFIMVNYLASRHYARRDVTRQQLATLSDRTRQTLSTLKSSVAITVFYGSAVDDQATQRLHELASDLLREYERRTPKIRLEFVDPLQDVARARQLVQQAQLDPKDPDILNLILVTSGTRQTRLTDTDLADYDYDDSQPHMKAFKGEDAITSAIVNVTQATTRLIWCTTGHGEKSLDDQEPLGLSNLKRSFEQQNMTLKTVTLLEQGAIPPEVKMLVIAGPQRRFTEYELLALEAYLDQGGKLLALIDPLNDSSLDGLLAKWGVALGMDIVVDPARRLPGISPANLLVTSYTQHPIVGKMKTLLTLFPLARSVQPTAPIPPGLAVTPLALTSEAGWGETKTSVETFQFNPSEDVKGPVSIAVAVERTASPATRLVVVGDSDFAVNAQLGNGGNRDLLLGTLYWLIGQEQLIGIGPKPLESMRLTVTDAQLIRLFWLSFVGLPVAFGVFGVGVWWLRRT